MEEKTYTMKETKKSEKMEQERDMSKSKNVSYIIDKFTYRKTFGIGPAMLNTNYRYSRSTSPSLFSDSLFG